MSESAVSQMSPSSACSLSTFLVAYDFNEASELALHLGLDLGKALNARVVILYVESPAEMTDEIESGVGDQQLHSNDQRRLDKLLLHLGGNDLDVSTLHRVGIVADILEQEAASQHADLVLMGAYGSHRLDPPRLGSTVEAMIRDISCDVLVIGPDAVTNAGSLRDVHRIEYLKADDDPAPHPRWLDKLAHITNSSIEIDYVVRPEASTASWRHQRLEAECKNLADAYRTEHMPTTWHLLYGGPASIVSTVVQAGRTSFLVLDSALISHHLRDARWLASLVIQNAPCPVILISTHSRFSATSGPSEEVRSDAVAESAA